MILTEMGEKPEGLRLTSASRVAEPAAYLTAPTQLPSRSSIATRPSGPKPFSAS